MDIYYLHFKDQIPYTLNDLSKREYKGLQSKLKTSYQYNHNLKGQDRSVGSALLIEEPSTSLIILYYKYILQ